MSNVITCQNCNTEFDGRFAEPGAKFRCTTCGSVVAVSINHNPEAAPRSPAPTAGVELIRGGSSTFGAPVGSTYGPPQPQQYAPQAGYGAPGYAPQPSPVAPPALNAPPPASTWVPNKNIPTVRGHGIPILLFVCTLGLYWIVWWYKTHSEHPRRKDIDPSTAGAMWLFVPVALSDWLVSLATGVVAAKDSFKAGLGARAAHPTVSEAIWSPYAHMSEAQRILTVIGCVASLGTAVLLYRLTMRMTDRLNLLATTLPQGPFVQPKVNRSLALWSVMLHLVGTATAAIPVVCFAGGLATLTSYGLMIAWWCQAQSVSDKLATNALTGSQIRNMSAF
jgi:hypothetical protein